MSDERSPSPERECSRVGSHRVRAFQPPDLGQGVAADYDAALDRVFGCVAERQELLARERGRAPDLLAELAGLPAGRQKLLIRNSRRFQSWALCQLLVQQSHQLGFSDPAASRNLAELATEVAERLDKSWYGDGLIHDLRAAAWAQLGNALRVSADLRRSEEAFRIAEHLLELGSGDPLERARLLDLLASLRRAQRRLDDGIRLLETAIGLYEEVGEQHRAGRAMIKLGTLDDLAGHTDLAVRRLQEGLARIDAAEEPRLVLYAHHNLLVLLADNGRAEEACALLAETRRLHQRFGNELSRVRLKWVEGKIAAGLGHFAVAEKELLAAQKGFIDRGIGYTAAMVCLDLASLYARLGRTGELRRLAAEMVPLFRSQDVHREALAALLLFHQAVEAERVTQSLIDQVRSYLGQARENPRLRFHPTPPPSP